MRPLKGDIVDGYMYIGEDGSDPADENNWEALGIEDEEDVRGAGEMGSMPDETSTMDTMQQGEMGSMEALQEALAPIVESAVDRALRQFIDARQQGEMGNMPTEHPHSAEEHGPWENY